MSIFTYNGAAIIAMAGKDCIAIGSDLRFGVQLQTMTTDYKKVFQVGGLGGDEGVWGVLEGLQGA
jgi:20S proteasome subunit beta 3